MAGRFGEQLLGGCLCSSAADRNRGPILKVLENVLPSAGLVLEVASGTGQHVVHFARALPELIWQPTDPDAELRRAAAARIEAAKLANLRAPLDLDVFKQPWPVDCADALLCINMIHIAPWAAAEALLEGTSRLLTAGGVVFLYGPYRRFGHHTAPSNEAFDRSLRARNPAWGVRDLEAVTELADGTGFEPQDLIEMPANNFSVIFRKR